MKTAFVQTLCLTLILALIAGSAVFTEPAYAQVYRKKTYGYVIVSPNPVGVNQDVLLIFGLTDYLYQWPDGFEGITITVERPDGKTETLGPFKTDSTGATGTVYKPTMVGTYYFQLHFPGQNYTWPATPGFDPTFRAGTTTYFQPCTSEKTPLTVQEQPLPTHPGFPPPQEYWTRPIDSQIREWTYIAGNWPSFPRNAFAPYNQGPETPHILWAKPLLGGAFSPLGGGLVGGFTDETSGLNEHGFETGDAYEGLFWGALVGFRRTVVALGGVLYFNRYKADGGTRVEQEVVAVDIRTGEELWVRNWGNRTLSMGQLFYWDSFNYHGVFAYLISTRTVGTVTYWDFYEASSGRWVFSYSNVPSGTVVYGPKGEILIYTVDLTRGWMTKWNSTHVVTQRRIQVYGPTGSMHGSWIRGDMGTTLDARLGIMWNKTIPRGLLGSVWDVIPDDMVVGNQLWGSWMVQGDMPCVFWALDLRPGREGRLLYNVTWQKPLGDKAVVRGAVSPTDRVFTLRVKEDRTIYGFDLDTGRQIWGPIGPLDIRSIYGTTQWIAYGKLIITLDFAGKVYCFDVKTGKQLWEYEVRDPYGLSEMWQKEFAGDTWAIVPLFITDHKVYLGHDEHSPNNPLPRGAPFICLDIDTGKEIFRVNGLFRQSRWGGRAIIADSIILTQDTYDQRVYAIGKGPSFTTVSVSPKVASNGQTIVIEGTVMDISPGTRDVGVALRFPHGVPAVADECMGEWMLYVYKQFPRPTGNMKGVWVKLDAVNVYTGEYIDIGGTFTDPYSGMFTVSWQPPKEGLWWIIASFPGSKSYYPSCAQTSIAVTPPTPTPTPATPEQVQTIQTTIEAITPLITAVAILVIIAIIIGAANLYIYLRRK
ncbi:MAG: PQQ-binding-like beta-propeller repeat protein [Candidatus Bathyarchaeia archaeon]